LRLSRIKLDHFPRFSDLEIKEIPETAKLVMLAGPNGCGKPFSVTEAQLTCSLTLREIEVEPSEGHYGKTSRVA
jgi:predicted ATP-binding protein involved in virulence